MKKGTDTKARGFGTFEGVFTPTILTILGVIMYLRLGWVVGNAGVGGAVLIILLAKIVTITTGLSIASMTSNIKVGAGGTYALISRSLGLEVGSAIGIPLYMSQALGCAMYIAGFTEAWLSIFPAHDPKLVGTIVMALLFTVSMISAKAAMKIQYAIMGIIVLSLVSFFLGRGDASSFEIVGWGAFSKAPFWVVFAIFFPAVTGIEAGAAMSGELADPRKSLKNGILIAIAISLVVYIAIAFWLDRLATPQELVGNYTIMMDVARWRVLIIAGVFGATLSSALGSIVGGPRTLMALAQDKAVPLSGLLSRLSTNKEPRNAIVMTTIIVEACILLGDLNTIAPLLTMVFLIAYGMINFAVLIEQGTGITSFRPSFKLPIFVPIVGAVWCLIVMLFINAFFAVAASLVLSLVYVIQVKRGLTTPWGDVRKAFFVSLAEWAAKISDRMPPNAKSWKPNLLIPVESPREWDFLTGFVSDIAYPGGTVRLFSVNVVQEQAFGDKTVLFERVRKRIKARKHSSEEAPGEFMVLKNDLNAVAANFKKRGIFTSSVVLDATSAIQGIGIATQVMHGSYFPPNILFLTLSDDNSKDDTLDKMVAVGIREEMGIIVFSHHYKASLGTKSTINVWLKMGAENMDLPLLTAMQLARNWGAEIRIVSAVENPDEAAIRKSIFKIAVQNARLPMNTEIVILQGSFEAMLSRAPMASLNILGFPKKIRCCDFHDMVKEISTSCLFVMDSGEETIWS